MTAFFQTRVENLDLIEERKKHYTASKKKQDKKNSDLSVIESIEESSVQHRPIKKRCTPHRKCSHTVDHRKYLKALANKHRKKKFKLYTRGKKESNALIEKKFQKFVRNKKR